MIGCQVRMGGWERFDGQLNRIFDDIGPMPSRIIMSGGVACEVWWRRRVGGGGGGGRGTREAAWGVGIGCTLSYGKCPTTTR